jgi:hypothetical protein
MTELPLPKFCGEPTADGDIMATWLREWYEANRETWWDRNNYPFRQGYPDRAGVTADNFMLELLGQVERLLGAKAGFDAGRK